MLESLFGNTTKEKVLLYLYAYQEGYAQEMRRVLGLPLRSVQLQLAQLEQGGVLVAKKVDRAIVYRLNPRYPFSKELLLMLEKLLQALPEKERNAMYTPRLRPRRIGKPL